ncbi:dihydrodipicolinate synthase family protein [Candidatus Woesearchaeota archaeon]|nr:dihydrodipicolinate synthase family protein [Candidatus Woesearchaeota archaeon]
MSILTCPTISTEGESDFRNVIKHAYARGKGADIIFILGTTGGFYILPNSDKKGLVDIAVDEVRKLIQGNGKPLELAIGVTGNNLDETVELAQYAEEKGADYAVLMPLYFSPKATDTVMTVVDETKTIKLILYNHPGKSEGRNIGLDEWQSLSLHERIPKLKDSSGDSDRARSYGTANGELHIGDEILGLSVPSNGIVAGSSNILPIAWARAARDKKSHVSMLLRGFQKVYASNPIGAFHYVLHKMHVISSDKPLDSSLGITIKLRREVDKLMKDDNFTSLYTMGF